MFNVRQISIRGSFQSIIIVENGAPKMADGAEDFLRREMELKKLSLEIEELRHSPRRADRTARIALLTALLTAITTLSVACLTGFLTYQAARFTSQQHDIDSYSKLLQDLGTGTTPA